MVCGIGRLKPVEHARAKPKIPFDVTEVATVRGNRTNIRIPPSVL